jgi:hypothetical protein
MTAFARQVPVEPSHLHPRARRLICDFLFISAYRELADSLSRGRGGFVLSRVSDSDMIRLDPSDFSDRRGRTCSPHVTLIQKFSSWRFKEDRS